MNSSQGLVLGSDYPRQSLEVWIDEAMSETFEGKACKRLMLVHCREGQDAREVWTCPINGKKPRDIAEMLERKARSVAQDLSGFGSGIQAFEVWAYYGDEDRMRQWHPIIIRSKTPRDGMGTEGPTGSGPEAQRMRHAEMIVGQAYGKQAHLDAQHMGLITYLGNSLMSALAANAQLAKDAIEAMRREQDRSHEYRMQEIGAIKSMAFQEKLLAYAPALANTAFGKEIFPQGTADTALLTTTIEGMVDKNPAMIEMLIAAVKDDPIIGGPLVARIAEIVKAKNDKEEEREKALKRIPEGPKPEDDAAGGPVIKLVTDGKKKAGGE
jgi:hypothetical protein